MNFKDIPNGSYIAKIQNYGVSTDKNGSPQILINFGFDVNGEQTGGTWYGSLTSEKGKEITVDTLIRCGLRGNDVSLVGYGPDSNALDMNKELEIVVDEDHYEGKTYKKIKWVNLPGSSLKTVEASEAVALLKGLNLTGEVVARRQKQGIPAQEAIPQKGREDLDVGF